MQATVESLGDHERRLTFSLPADRLKEQVDGRLGEIARTTRLKGFRPGKVPRSVVEQRFGKQVREEVREQLLRATFNEAVREHELQIAGNPDIQPASDAADDVQYVASFEVVPDFGGIEVEKLEVVRHTSEVTDADIDTMIENLRAQRRSWQIVERGAQADDAVELETWSQVGDERVPAEGSERGTSVVGAGSMLPALESALEGMKAGEEKQVEVEFPADWRAPQFAGKTAQVNLKAVKVSEPVVPDVDEEFIKSFGVRSGDADQFRTDIRSNLERELKGALMARLRREVSEKLVEAYGSREMPPKLVESEARNMAFQAAEQARRQGRPSQLPENAHEQFMDGARRRVLVGLLVGEVARRNELRLDPARVNETLNLIASTYEEPQQVVDLYRQDAQLMQGLQGRVMEEQVIDWIAERASHTDQALPFAEAIRQ